MFQLLKREFYLNRIYFLIVFLTFPLIHGVVYPLLVFGSILGFAMYQSFYDEFKNHVNHSLVSMPIKKEYIVLARYLFLLCAIILSFLYLWLIDNFANVGLPVLDFGKKTGLSLFLMAILFGLMLAILIPFFYYFQSFQKVFLIHLLLLFVCLIVFTLFVENPAFAYSANIYKMLDTISNGSVLIPVVFALGCLCISYKLSVYFLNKQDMT